MGVQIELEILEWCLVLGPPMNGVVHHQGIV